jgi:hypothetical protein
MEGNDNTKHSEKWLHFYLPKMKKTNIMYILHKSKYFRHIILVTVTSLFNYNDRMYMHILHTRNGDFTCST